MHGLSGELDMRKMGNVKKYMPITFATFFIGCLAIAGIPPFAGFFSKDEILWEAFKQSKILWLLADIAAFMTAFYMFRAVFMTFFGKSRMDKEVEHHVHESPPTMTYPLMALAVLSTVGGLVGIPIMKGWNKFHEFLAPVIGGHGGEHAAEQSTSGLAFASEAATQGAGEVHHYSVGFELFMMEVSVAIGLAGIIAAWYLYIKRPDLPGKIAERFKGFYHLLVNKYFVDEIYHAWVVTPINIISTGLWKGFDEKFIDGSLVNGSAWLIQKTSGVLRRLQTGSVQHYALSILVGLVLILYLIMK